VVVKRRLSVLLAAVMMLAATLAVSAPAWADPGIWVCTTPDGTQLEFSNGQLKQAQKRGELPTYTICTFVPK